MEYNDYAYLKREYNRSIDRIPGAFPMHARGVRWI